MKDERDKLIAYLKVFSPEHLDQVEVVLEKSAGKVALVFDNPQSRGWIEARDSLSYFINTYRNDLSGHTDTMLHQWIKENGDLLNESDGQGQAGRFTVFFQDFDEKLHTSVFSNYLLMISIINKYETPEAASMVRSDLPEFITSFDDYKDNEQVIIKRLNDKYTSKISSVRRWVVRYLRKRNPSSLHKVDSIISDALSKTQVDVNSLNIVLPCALRRAYEKESYAKAATWSTEHPVAWDIKPALTEYLYFRDVPLSRLDEYVELCSSSKTPLEDLFHSIEPESAKPAFESRDQKWPLLFPFWRNSWYPRELVPTLKPCLDICELEVLKNGSRDIIPIEGEVQTNLTELDSVEYPNEADSETENSVGAVPTSPTRSLGTEITTSSLPRSTPSEVMSVTSGSRSWLSRQSSRPPIFAVNPTKKVTSIKMPDNDAPQSLTVTSPNLKEVRGEFLLSSSPHRSLPFWKQSTSDKVLYCGAKDKWLVGTLQVMEKSRGWMMSSDVHDGRYPHEMPSWHVRLNGWSADPQVVIQITPPKSDSAAQPTQQVSQPASSPPAQAAPRHIQRSPSPAAGSPVSSPQLGVSVSQLLQPLLQSLNESDCQRCLKFQKIVEMQQVENEKAWLQLQNEKDRVAALETSMRILREQQQLQPQRGGSPFSISQAEEVASVDENSAMISLQQKYDEERIKVNSLSRQLEFLRDRESTRDDVGMSITTELHQLNEKSLEIAQRQISRTRDAITQISTTLATQQEGRLTTLLGSMILNIEKDALQWSREICPSGLEKRISQLNQQLKHHRDENGSPPLVPPPETEVDVMEMQRTLNRLQKKELEAPIRTAELQVVMGEQQRDIVEREKYISSLRIQLNDKDRAVSNLQTQLDAAHAAMGLMSGRSGSSSPQPQRKPPLILRGGM